MNMQAETPPDAAIWRFLGNPLVRLVLFMLLAFGIGAAMRYALPSKSPGGPQDEMALHGAELWLHALRNLVPTVLAYWLMVRLAERRKLSELRPAKVAKHLPIGWLIGMGRRLAAAAAMAAFGAYRVQGIDTGAPLLAPFIVLGVLPGITEEIVARGILFRVVEDGLGTWFALAFSALLFGAGHLANPNATVWSSAAIAIEAGLLLGMAYAWTRSLWFVMALHAAWNFTQGPLLGIAVSGIATHGLLRSTTQGPEVISGGPFGAEASILTVIICVSVAAFFTRKAILAGRIKVPSFRSLRVYLILAAVYLLVVGSLVFTHRDMRLTGTVVLLLPVLMLLGASPAPARGRADATGEPLP